MIKKVVHYLTKVENTNPTWISFFINDYYLIRKGLYKAVKEESINFSGIILDFGCGTRPYEKFFTNVEKYVGLDIEIKGWEERQRYADVFYDGKKIPFEDNTFDSIISVEVLEHVFNIDELLKEINRVLKAGGKAIITTPFMWEEHEMPYDFARYTTPGLIHIYEKHNFTILKKIKNGNNIMVICQFIISYIKSLLPKNKWINHLFLIPVIVLFNTFALVLSKIVPGDKTMYFNNIFILEKKQKSL